MKNTRAVLVAVVLGALAALSVAACSAAVPEPVPVATPAPAPVLNAPPVVPATAPAPSVKKSAPKTETTKTTAPKKKPKKCTDQRDYSNDPRDNATINSIGETLGKCPKPLTHESDGAGGGKGAGYTGSCLDTGTCYDPAGSAPGEGLSDEQYSSSGEAQYDWGCRQGYIVEGC